MFPCLPYFLQSWLLIVNESNLLSCFLPPCTPETNFVFDWSNIRTEHRLREAMTPKYPLTNTQKHKTGALAN